MPGDAGSKRNIRSPGSSLPARPVSTSPTLTTVACAAVSVAALTLYDMVKAVEKSMVISDISLRMKDGGKSGRYEADE